MPPPQALLRWFASQYPTLRLDPGWLDPCIEYLTTYFPNTPTPQLIKLVESQLLLSDLATSTLPPTHFPDPLPSHATLFPTTRGAVLFQITSIDEIGHAALGQLEVLKGKREARRLQLAPRERKDGDEEELEGVYPRGMTKVGLSDGHREVRGIEWQRVAGLGLEDCKLGAKILVHDVKVVNGFLLLSPHSVVVKGNMVEEFEETAEYQLETQLRKRLGMPALPAPPVPPQNDGVGNENLNPTPEVKPAVEPVPPKAGVQPARAIPAPRAAGGTRNPPPPTAPKPRPSVSSAPRRAAPHTKRPDDYDLSDDLFELDAEAEAELERLEAVALHSVVSGSKRRKVDEGPPEPLPSSDKRLLADVDLELDGLDFDMVDAPPECAMLPAEGRNENGNVREREGQRETKREDGVMRGGIRERARIGQVKKPATEKKRVEVLELDDSEEDLKPPEPKSTAVKRIGGGADVIVLD